MHLNVHSITHGTLTNGPGKRSMLHLQGCSLKCSGCFSPHTWSTEENKLMPVTEILGELLKDSPDGITISGGEPLQQAEGTLSLLRSIRGHKSKNVASISILMYTGYTSSELHSQKVYSELSLLLDVLISGRYDRTRHTGRELRGSANQEITLFSDKHSEAEITGNNNILEVLIDSEGIHMTGFPTKEVIKNLKNSLEGI